MNRPLVLALLLPAFALGQAKPALTPFDPDPFIVDTSLVAMPISCPVTTPRAAFDGANYLVVWDGPWHGSQDSIVATRLSQSGSILDPSGIRIGVGTAPSTAFGGGSYLVTWEQDSAIRCVRVSAAGAVLDTPVTVTSVHGAAPVVAFNGANYLIAWGGQDVYAARVSTAGVVIDTGGILVSGASGVQEFPAVAYDGTNCLITWQDMRPGGYLDIYGARVTPSGSVLDPSGIPISSAAYSQYYPAVSFDGTNYLVAWQDYRTTDFDIYASRVTPAGMVLDADGVPIATSAIYQRYPSVSFGQGSYLVTWERWDGVSNQGIWGARIQTSGVPRDTGFCIAPAGARFAPVIFDGSRYFVSWEESGILATWIDTSGHVQDQSGTPVYAAANDQRQPNAAFNGTNYLVIWQDERQGDSADIRGIRISRSGTQVDPRPLTVSAARKAQSNPAAASNGTDFLVVWSDLRSDTSRIYAARVSQSGAVLDTAGIRVCSAAGSQTQPSVACNGSDYLVAWQDGRSSPTSVYAARVTSGGVVMDPQGLRVCSDASGQDYPGVSFDGTNCLVVWRDSRSGTDIYGARIDASGNVLDPTGFMISPDTLSKAFPAVDYCGDRYFVIWLRLPRSIDGAFVSPSGVVLDTITSVWNKQAGPARPTVAFDGTNAAVAWENITGNDIYAATLDLSGNRLDTFALAATSAKEYGPRLTTGPSGRVLAVYSAKIDTAAGRPWYCRRVLGDFTAFGGIEAESPTGRRSAMAVFPNPFRSTVRIVSSLLSSLSSVRIFDSQGRLVRVLPASSLLSPPASLTWDATDSRGRKVPSGVYIISVKLGSAIETQPLTFIGN